MDPRFFRKYADLITEAEQADDLDTEYLSLFSYEDTPDGCNIHGDGATIFVPELSLGDQGIEQHSLDLRNIWFQYKDDIESGENQGQASYVDEAVGDQGPNSERVYAKYRKDRIADRIKRGVPPEEAAKFDLTDEPGKIGVFDPKTGKRLQENKMDPKFFRKYSDLITEAEQTDEEVGIDGPRAEPGELMARDGYRYTNTNENELIDVIAEYLSKMGYSDKEIRIKFRKEDYLPDQLSYLPKAEGEELSEGKITIKHLSRGMPVVLKYDDGRKVAATYLGLRHPLNKDELTSQAMDDAENRAGLGRASIGARWVFKTADGQTITLSKGRSRNEKRWGDYVLQDENENDVFLFSQK